MKRKKDDAHQLAAMTMMPTPKPPKRSAIAATRNGPVPPDIVISGRTRPVIAPRFARPKYVAQTTWFRPTHPPMPKPAMAPAASTLSPGMSSSSGTVRPFQTQITSSALRMCTRSASQPQKKRPKKLVKP